MTNRLKVALYLCGLFSAQVYAESARNPVIVASKGQTILTASVGSVHIQVTIHTHELKTWSHDEHQPRQPDSNCIQERTPCSIVDSIKIAMNGKPAFVFRSVYADLADLNDAKLVVGKQISTLTLTGGDAADSYIVKIEFDGESVKRRTVAPGEDADEPTQETTYHMVTIGD